MFEGRGGTCYTDSFDSLMYDPEYKDWTLVHGIAINTSLEHGGNEFGHAWLESPDEQTVFDAASGKTVPKFLYYAIGHIEYTHKYNKEEARKAAVEAGTYGPWDEKIASTIHYDRKKRKVVNAKSKVEQLNQIVDEIIRKVPGKNKYQLISKKTGRVLGTHSSREKARKQEIAIKISQHK